MQKKNNNHLYLPATPGHPKTVKVRSGKLGTAGSINNSLFQCCSHPTITHPHHHSPTCSIGKFRIPLEGTHHPPPRRERANCWPPCTGNAAFPSRLIRLRATAQTRLSFFIQIQPDAPCRTTVRTESQLPLVSQIVMLST